MLDGKDYNKKNVLGKDKTQTKEKSAKIKNCQ